MDTYQEHASRSHRLPVALVLPDWDGLDSYNRFFLEDFEGAQTIVQPLVIPNSADESDDCPPTTTCLTFPVRVLGTRQRHSP